MNIHNFFQFKPAVKHLPALAAAVAVTLALAFTPREVQQEEWGYDDGWHNVTGLTIGEDYECDENITEICTYEAPSFEAEPVKTNGRFTSLQ